MAYGLLAAGSGNLGTWSYVPRLPSPGWRRQILAYRLFAAGLGNLRTLAWVPGLRCPGLGTQAGDGNFRRNGFGTQAGDSNPDIQGIAR